MRWGIVPFLSITKNNQSINESKMTIRLFDVFFSFRLNLSKHFIRLKIISGFLIHSFISYVYFQKPQQKRPQRTINAAAILVSDCSGFNSFATRCLYVSFWTMHLWQSLPTAQAVCACLKILASLTLYFKESKFIYIFKVR